MSTPALPARLQSALRVLSARTVPRPAEPASAQSTAEHTSAQSAATRRAARARLLRAVADRDHCRRSRRTETGARHPAEVRRE